MNPRSRSTTHSRKAFHANAHVTLSEQHVRLIEVLVASGRYRNAAEAIGEALGLLDQREASSAARIASLRPSVTAQAPATGWVLVAEFEERTQAAYEPAMRSSAW